MSDGYQDHEDHRGVFVRLWTIDLLDGDFHAALLFNQLLWWHRPNLDGTPKLRYERDGYRWLLRADDGWDEECRMTTKQVRRVRSVLVKKGLVEHRRFKLNGAPTSAWRPLHDAIQAIRPKPELPSEGQFHGTTPQGAVGSDPGGAVPIPLGSRDLEIREPIASPTKGATSFPEEFLVTEAMRAWAAENAPGIDYRLQTAQFADHHRAKGSRMKDWEAAWRLWMRNAVTFNRNRSPSQPPDQPRLSKSRQNSDRVYERMLANERARSEGNNRLGLGELAPGDH